MAHPARTLRCLTAPERWAAHGARHPSGTRHHRSLLIVDRLEGAQSCSEVGSELAVELHHFAGGRVHERQLGGVQERTLELQLGTALAVDGITDQRMIDRAEVDADLVRATGLQPALEQRQIRGTVEAPSDRIRPGAAPSASRIPNSRARAATPNAMTP